MNIISNEVMFVFAGGCLRAGSAVGFGARLLGLLTGPPRCLWLAPCSAVHTCGMRYPLDLVFLDTADFVLAVRQSVPPWRFVWIPGAIGVIEIPAPADVLPRVGEFLERVQ